ncbi:hypothetical protein [Riemerella columbipharyngis]|uniref:hypothetical protein n=1 Tax=Riemerella columbipharyngis TaxID=1071918 RepID=UPI00159FD23A|nr:hypothetical protein [Riemerella columbipharyngis]
MSVPKGNWGKADWYEPITKDFMEFGEGGATQAITSKPIKLDDIVDISSCK